MWLIRHCSDFKKVVRKKKKERTKKKKKHNTTITITTTTIATTTIPNFLQQSQAERVRGVGGEEDEERDDGQQFPTKKSG